MVCHFYFWPKSPKFPRSLLTVTDWYISVLPNSNSFSDRLRRIRNGDYWLGKGFLVFSVLQAKPSQWSQRTITMLIFWSFLGKVNEVNAISHYTHMNCPICWDYLRTFTMLIFSAFLGKSMKSTHDHYDRIFWCF